MEDEESGDHPGHRSGAERSHRDVEDPHARREQQRADDGEDVTACLPDLLRLAGNHQQRHLRAGFLAAGAARALGRGPFHCFPGRGGVTVHGVEAVAALAHADDFARHAHGVQPPVDGAADEQAAEPAAGERGDERRDLVHGGDGADDQLKHDARPGMAAVSCRAGGNGCERLLSCRSAKRVGRVSSPRPRGSASVDRRPPPDSGWCRQRPAAHRESARPAPPCRARGCGRRECRRREDSR